MKTIEIKASDFFELLKIRNVSMWEIFSQIIDGEPKSIIFLDNQNQILFHYVLPENAEKLEEDRKVFAKEYAEKLKNAN